MSVQGTNQDLRSFGFRCGVERVELCAPEAARCVRTHRRELIRTQCYDLFSPHLNRIGRQNRAHRFGICRTAFPCPSSLKVTIMIYRMSRKVLYPCRTPTGTRTKPPMPSRRCANLSESLRSDKL